MLEEKPPYPGSRADGQAGALPSWGSLGPHSQGGRSSLRETRGPYEDIGYGVGLAHSGANEQWKQEGSGASSFCL